jgi:hypothetical protein
MNKVKALMSPPLVHRAGMPPVGEVAASRRRFSAIVLTWLISGTLQARAQGLSAARSLPDELAAALRRGGPLVVMVSLEGCAYCHIVREQYLAPLAREGLAVVQVDWRSKEPLQGFSGLLTHDEQVRAWKVRIAPTLLFLGAGGREVAPRLVGMSSADFYGAYLDARLEQARKAARS